MRNNKPETQEGQELAGKAGEFMIGNDLRVTRLGFGAMRITGNGIWGEPSDRAGSIRLLRRSRRSRYFFAFMPLLIQSALLIPSGGWTRSAA